MTPLFVPHSLCRPRVARTRSRRRWLALAALAALADVTALQLQPASAADRVASLNLCADQLLLTLAPERIGSLSPLARDPALSFLARQAGAHPANPGHGETMVVDPPSLVLAGAYDGRARRAWLAARGIDLHLVRPWRSLADGRDEIRRLADRLGEAGRGEALIAAIDTALAASRGLASGPRTILPLQTRGYTPGEGALVLEILRNIGLTPYAGTIGLPDGGFVRLEQIVATPPDYLLVARETVRAYDQGTALLIHPALVRAVPRERWLVVPGPLLSCEGPATPGAIEALTHEVRAKVR